ncbi:MAG TPA: DUF1127 domain-containing protein [Casimicrobiaceae bacterium]|jgi:uncharacterized protein YjiS (DUF1127 family)
MRTLIEWARQISVRYRQHRRALETRAALAQLDDRVLHDLGFDRSEIASIAAEANGEAEYTRSLALWWRTECRTSVSRSTVFPKEIACKPSWDSFFWS